MIWRCWRTHNYGALLLKQIDLLGGNIIGVDDRDLKAMEEICTRNLDAGNAPSFVDSAALPVREHNVNIDQLISE